MFGGVTCDSRGFRLTSVISVSEPSAKIIGEWGQIRTRKSTQDEFGFGSWNGALSVGVFLQRVRFTSLTDEGSNNHGWNELLGTRWPI